MSSYDKLHYEKNRQEQKTRKLTYYHKVKSSWTPEQKAKKMEYLRNWYENNKERINAHRKEIRRSNPEIRKQQDETYRKQRTKRLEVIAGRPKPETCEVCGSAKKIMFDHDHKTAQFRGWICYSCNTALGHVGDSKEHLSRLIVYLEASEQSTIRSMTFSELKSLMGISQK